MGQVTRYSGMKSLLTQAGFWGGDIILMFHRILPENEVEECFDPHLVLAEAGFLELLEILGNEYQWASLTEIAAEDREELSKPRVALTFDDGWEDTYRVAYPHLKRLQVPATVFLCTNLVGTTRLLPEERLARIWQHALQTDRIAEFHKNLTTWGVISAPSVRARLQAVKQIPNAHKHVMLSVLERLHDVPEHRQRHMMNWLEVHEMASHGIEFGSHTASHVTLTAEPEEQVVSDLQQSVQTLTQQLGKAPAWLAYPNGMVDAFVAETARRLGFQGAVTTRPGSMLRNRLHTTESADIVNNGEFLLPRCNMEDSAVATPSHACDAARLTLYFSKHTWPHSYVLPVRTQVRSASLNLPEEPVLVGSGHVIHSQTIPQARERCRQR